VAQGIKKLSDRRSFGDTHLSSTYKALRAKNRGRADFIIPPGAAKLAAVTLHESEREVWLKRRGQKVQTVDSKAFSSFVKELFSTLDNDGSGTLEPEELILPLLSLGLAPSASYLEKVVSW
jgi:hypothetical protein